MSTATPGAKKAVHVKWAGKTIALGTFPAAEADEKCARAKALTRAWRSTMRPKPHRDWVMNELERLNVRVVSGRLSSGRKDDDDEEGGGGGDGTGAPPSGDQRQSIGWNPSDDFDSMMQRRTSSIGFNRNGSLGLGLAVDDTSRRPFVGGGSASAYEAARADHYISAGDQKGAGVDRSRSLGMGGGGMAVNPNQHYEMLKLHHMNLLNEIQETTLMMNLYQQQQLQQQQEQLQKEGDSGTPSGRASIGINPPMYGGGGGAVGFVSRQSIGGGDSMASASQQGSKVDDLAAAQEQQQLLEERLRRIKEDIASRQKEADESQGASTEEEGSKRKAENDGNEETGATEKKRAKGDKDEKTAGKAEEGAAGDSGKDPTTSKDDK